jgi:hypothetical protein
MATTMMSDNDVDDDAMTLTIATTTTTMTTANASLLKRRQSLLLLPLSLPLSWWTPDMSTKSKTICVFNYVQRQERRDFDDVVVDHVVTSTTLSRRREVDDVIVEYSTVRF